MFPSRRELHTYLVDGARQWKLEDHVRCSTVVNKAVWKGNNEWSIQATTTQDEKTGPPRAYETNCKYLVTAVGQLHNANIPNFPGLKDFKGKLMHTFEWDEDELIEGKNVAIIGNGATGVQVIPDTTSRAKQLTVFQRSPSWVIPRKAQTLSRVQQTLYRYFPTMRKYYRTQNLDEQDARHAMVVDNDVRALGEEFSKDYLASQVPSNSNLRAQLTPSYPFGCKRVVLADEFYLALNQEHVILETRPIECITRDGIRVEGTATPFDLLIFATGFKAQTFLNHIEITDESGRALCADGLRAYQGVVLENLPNFAMLYGPNTNLSHVSVMLMIEAQARYISAIIRVVHEATQAGRSLAICPKPQAVARYNNALQKALKKTVFTSSGCTSWYKAEDGTVTNTWPGTARQYQKELSVLNWEDYDLVGPGFNDVPEGLEDLGGPIERPLNRILAFLSWLIDLTLGFLDSRKR